MLDPFAKVRPGQPLQIPAAAYNAFIDAAKATQGVLQSLAVQSDREQRQQAIVPIKNTSGAAVPRFGVIGIDGPLFSATTSLDAFQRHFALTGSTPSVSTHTGNFAIAVEPIPIGGLGRACVAGLCVAQVDFPVDGRDRKFADVAEGVNANLQAKDRGAASIVWRETGTGVKWALVHIGRFTDARIFPIKLTQIGGAQGSDVAAATWTYDVRDLFTNDLLASAIDPTAPPHHWRRPAIGNLSPATIGLAYHDSSDAFVLIWINETLELEACS